MGGYGRRMKFPMRFVPWICRYFRMQWGSINFYYFSTHLFHIKKLCGLQYWLNAIIVWQYTFKLNPNHWKYCNMLEKISHLLLIYKTTKHSYDIWKAVWVSYEVWMTEVYLSIKNRDTLCYQIWTHTILCKDVSSSSSAGVAATHK